MEPLLTLWWIIRIYLGRITADGIAICSYLIQVYETGDLSSVAPSKTARMDGVSSMIRPVLGVRLLH